MALFIDDLRIKRRVAVSPKQEGASRVEAEAGWCSKLHTNDRISMGGDSQSAQKCGGSEGDGGGTTHDMPSR
ncbi:hypothetical protein AV521_08460 [Streptomyces sp. IMTB 2501]|nr:hypothetical protein AV521_08460 [Streptomyces sp. IMTB 2501]